MTLLPIIGQVGSHILGRSFQEYTAGSHERVVPGLTIAGVTILTIILIWLIILRERQRRQPFLLFYDLVSLHRLAARVERRLMRMARVHRIGDPALLFVCPDLVEQIKSLEVSQARSDKERRHVEAFFSDFTAKVFG